ncbi:helix-turn-helix domain-containing protein [Dethiosulfatarculus sandiegensis]|uniref:DNA-binding protein n=1 Tax=Dethiosulfatarculus sandiegensis TaxID=1429043 RepID=A0A0D2JX48_9BACT|nr:XRE family transcriptional regulator [Dethiosulfatarculus sandiegensis]KIX14155.1 DNA-binding protein [Dethiosulfatarculus sandiegensis]
MKSEVGQRIASYRKKQNLSLEELALRTNLESEFLRALEEMETYPSLGPLLKIARALGVRLGTFLDDHFTDDPLVTRLEKRQQQIVTHRGDKAKPETVFYSLGKGKVDRHMEPFFVELMPESAKEPGLSSHEGEEFIVVTSGKAQLIYGQETYTLNTGDSVYYNSVVPHHLGCYGDEKATIYAVLYFPE